MGATYPLKEKICPQNLTTQVNTKERLCNQAKRCWKCSQNVLLFFQYYFSC